MTTDASAAPALNDDAQLEYTQSIRRKIVDRLMPDGVVPTSEDSITQILSVLKDHDKVTLTLKRIDADKENSGANALALAMFHKMAEINGSKDVMRRDPADVPSGVPTTTPHFQSLDTIDEFPQIDESHMRREADPVNYDKIMAEGRERLRDRIEKGQSSST